MKEKTKRAIEIIAKRAANILGGGLLVSGDDLANAAGVGIILFEFGIQVWRERRKNKKAAKVVKGG